MSARIGVTAASGHLDVGVALPTADGSSDDHDEHAATPLFDRTLASLERITS